MKLNKNMVQIGTTAMITSLAFIIPMATTRTGLFSSSPVDSSRITWNEALAMQTQYLGFKPLRVQFPENNSTGTRENLQGFSFNASQLNEIINGNLSGQNPDKVYFLFGQEGVFNDGLLNQSANMRLTAVGVLNGNILKNPQTGTNISLFDKADPCPPNCPR